MDYAQQKEEFRQRTKGFASATIRFYCTLPKNRTEVHVLGKQLLLPPTTGKRHVLALTQNSSPRSINAPRKLTNRCFGLNCCATTAASGPANSIRFWPNPTN